VPADPLVKFQAWFNQATASEPTLPTAASLATATRDAVPSVRMVLCKSWSQEGFVVYTNLSSPKAEDLRENPRASLCFHWKSLKRQVRVSGPVNPVSDEQADAYFAARDRGSQLGAWASRQSSPLPNPLALEAGVAKYAAKFGVSTVPRPPFWSGFVIQHQRVEFWEEMPFRLHRRVVWRRADQGWETEGLFP